MQVLLISLFSALTVYLLINIIFLSSGKEVVRSRVVKYFKENNANDVQEQFIREKNAEGQKQKKDRFKIASKDFSNYISSSGLKLTATEFIYMWTALTLLPMVVIILFGGSMLTATAVCIVGFAIPPILVGRARKQRGELFNKQLSEALVIMGNSIKGGFTFAQSMESVAEDMHPPISSEFAKVLREIHYGVSQEEALNHMVERSQNQDLELLVSAVITSSQVGSNLTEILDTISETIRDRIKIKQEINTLTAQGRISGIIIGSLPVVLLLVIMIINPEYYEGFFDSLIGKLLMVISIVMELIGFAVIKKIINIKM
jgi:tight adherence protein B